MDTSKVRAEVLPLSLQRDVLSLWWSVHEELVSRSSLQEDDVTQECKCKEIKTVRVL